MRTPVLFFALFVLALSASAPRASAQYTGSLRTSSFEVDDEISSQGSTIAANGQADFGGFLHSRRGLRVRDEVAFSSSPLFNLSIYSDPTGSDYGTTTFLYVPEQDIVIKRLTVAIQKQGSGQTLDFWAVGPSVGDRITLHTAPAAPSGTIGISTAAISLSRGTTIFFFIGGDVSNPPPPGANMMMEYRLQ